MRLRRDKVATGGGVFIIFLIRVLAIALAGVDPSRAFGLREREFVASTLRLMKRPQWSLLSSGA